MQRDVDGELVIYDPGRDLAFLLNRVAALIWSRCEGRESPNEIAAQLARLFGTPLEQVSQDVATTLEHFRKHGLLVQG